jgi:hypothetical protein
MIQQDVSARIGDESLERHYQQEDVVDLSQEWNEVGYVVERQQNVRERARDEQLVGERYTRIG